MWALHSRPFTAWALLSFPSSSLAPLSSDTLTQPFWMICHWFLLSMCCSCCLNISFTVFLAGLACHFLGEAIPKPPEWVRCLCQSVEMLIRLLSHSLSFPLSEKCHGPCITSSNCSQLCAQHFRGEIGFVCNQNKWQKSTETCTSLSVETLFEVIHLHFIDYRSPSPRSCRAIFSVFCSAWP